VLGYVRFETVRTLRNPGFLFLVTVVPVALYLIGARGVDEDDQIGGIPSSVWYLASATTIGAIGAAISGSGARLAAERASGWARQLRVTPLTERSWLVGRTLASLLVVLPVILVVGLLAVTVGDVRLDAAQWMTFTVIVVLGSIPIALIGLIVGLAFRAESAQAAQAVAFVLLAWVVPSRSRSSPLRP
jgi:ABC-2 type transport system permease protein